MNKFLNFLAITSISVCSITAFAENEGTIDYSTEPAPTYTIQILSPAPEETFQNSVQSITVQVAVTPELKAGDMVSILVDGEETAAQSSAAISLPWLARGAHTLQAKLKPLKGAPAESQVITIYQQRTSVKR